MASTARPRTWRRTIKTSSRLLRSSLTVGSAIAIANGLTAVTQLALARLLHPADYSLLVALFVVITVAGVPLGALQATVARSVATELAARGDRGVGTALHETGRELVRLSVPVAIATTALAVPIAIVLNVQRVAPLAATGVAVAASVALTIVWGGLQGTHHFTAFSLGQVGYAVLKLVTAIGAAWAGAGVGGVMGAIAAATTVMLAAGVIPLVPYLRAAAHAELQRRPLVTRYSGGAGASLTAFAILTTLDVLVARVALKPSVAGTYAAASVVARGVLLIPTAITTVLFPHVSILDDAARERRHLLGALAATVGAALGPVLLLLLAGRPIIELLFGARYNAAGSWAGPLAVAMAFYSIAFVYLFHSLSVGRTRFWLAALPVLGGQLAAFAVFHDSARELIGVQLAAAALLAVVGEVYDRRTG